MVSWITYKYTLDFLNQNEHRKCLQATLGTWHMSAVELQYVFFLGPNEIRGPCFVYLWIRNLFEGRYRFIPFLFSVGKKIALPLVHTLFSSAVYAEIVASQTRRQCRLFRRHRIFAAKSICLASRTALFQGFPKIFIDRYSPLWQSLRSHWSGNKKFVVYQICLFSTASAIRYLCHFFLLMIWYGLY